MVPVKFPTNSLIPCLYERRFVDVDTQPLGFLGFRRRTLEVSTLLREMFHEYRDAYNCRRLHVCKSLGTYKNVAAWWIYPLVNIYITMENHHAINGYIHYKSPFSIANC